MPARHRGRRLRLAGHIEHEQHRQAEPRGEVGGRAAAARRAGDAVEQAHDAFDDENLGALRGLANERVEQRRRHRPAVEIDARRAGRRRVEGGIDIVRPRLCRAHGDAAPPQRGEQAERHRGLARARARRRDDEAARGHRERPRRCRDGAEAFPCGHDVADHDDRRRLDALRLCISGNTIERRDEDAFACGGRRGDDGGGRVRREPARDQRLRDLGEIAHRHVEHDRLAGARQRRPVRRAIGVGAVAGGEDHGTVDAAQRRRDQRRGQRRKPRGDAGHDPERHARRGQRRRFLAAAGEHEGIAALEPQHPLAAPRQHDEALRNVVLDRRRLAAALAGEFEPRARPRERQHARIDQGVVDDHVGLGEPGQRVEGEQPGIARPSPGEPDMAGFEHRNAAAPRRKIRPAVHGADAPPSRRRSSRPPPPSSGGGSGWGSADSPQPPRLLPAIPSPTLPFSRGGSRSGRVSEPGAGGATIPG